MKKKSILIACDFGVRNDVAVNHGVALSRQMKADVVLLHILRKEESEQDVNDHFDFIKSEIHDHLGGAVKSITGKGNIFTSINQVAKEEGCDLIILPTYGIRGWQTLLGSDILKIVAGSHIPCVIVQERMPRLNGYKHIVIPIALHDDFLMEFEYFSKIAKAFHATIHLVSFKSTRERESLEFMNTIINIIQEDQLEVVFKDLEDSSHNERDLVRYAASVDADLICSASFSYRMVFSAFPRNDEEQLVYNDAMIPVLLVTPEHQEESGYLPPPFFC